MRTVNGLLLYRQYLENIRVSLVNCDLKELESKKFLDIMKREKEIEDIIYIDEILKKAGLNIFFLKGTDFISQKVKLKSKLGKVFGFDKDDYRTELLNDFLSDEDDIIERINSMFPENMDELGEFDVTTSVETLGVDDFIEKHKETLEALFKGMQVYGDMLKKEEEKVEEVEEEFEIDESEDIEEDKSDDLPSVEDTEIEEDLGDELFAGFEDILEDKSTNVVSLNLEDLDKSKDNEGTDDIDNFDSLEIEESDREENDNSEDIDFEEDLEESQEKDENEDDMQEIEHFKNKDVSPFFENDNAEKNEELLKSFNEDSLFDRTGIELEEELEADADRVDEEDLGNRFQNETDYFLHGFKRSRNETANVLKEMSKSKEKLTNSKDISDADDKLAKMLIGTSANIMTLPEKVVDAFKNLKNVGQKMKDTMIVTEGDDDEQ